MLFLYVLNIEYLSRCGGFHHQTGKSEIGGRYGGEGGMWCYCVLIVFNVFIRESVHTVKEVRFPPVGGRLVCYCVFCY